MLSSKNPKPIEVMLVAFLVIIGALFSISTMNILNVALGLFTLFCGYAMIRGWRWVWYVALILWLLDIGTIVFSGINITVFLYVFFLFIWFRRRVRDFFET